MADEQDAAPTQVGQYVVPEHYVMFGFGPDGRFFIDCSDNEAMVRQLLGFGIFEADRFLVARRMKSMIDKAQETAILESMAKDTIRKIDGKKR